MAYPMGEAKLDPLRVDFDRHLKLEFHGSGISSDGGLLPHRERRVVAKVEWHPGELYPRVWP